MKRITILAVLAFAATAVAATDGTYIQGNSTGSTKKGAGVSMTVSNGTFAINVLRYRETCRYGSRTVHDFITLDLYAMKFTSHRRDVIQDLAPTLGEIRS